MPHRFSERLSLKDRTVEYIFDAILSGRINPGERLNESKLARDLRISRAPIREALQQLQEQCLLINVARRGTFVVCLEQEDIQKINSLRLVLESEALRLCRRRLNPEREKTLKQLVLDMESMDAAPLKLSMRIDFDFHRTIWSFTGNEHLERTLTRLTAPLFAHVGRKLFRSDKLRIILDAHRPLFEFIRGDSEQTAEQIMLTHLSIRYEQPERFASIGRTPAIGDESA